MWSKGCAARHMPYALYHARSQEAMTTPTLSSAHVAHRETLFNGDTIGRQTNRSLESVATIITS